MDLFQHPIRLLWMLPALAGTAALHAWTRRRRALVLSAVGLPRTLERLLPPELPARRRVKFLLQAGGCGLLFAALAGPQWGVERVLIETRSLQAILAVDVSLSMLAEDVSPSRMEKAKAQLLGLVDGLAGERLGLIAFAGEAHVQCPLTTDSDAVRSLLDSIRVGMVPQPGTAIGKTVALGAKILSKYPGHKAMVLLTDGEDRVGDPDPLSAAREAAEAGIHLYLIGMGTPEGGPIPIKDASGKPFAYKKDARGDTVISKLAESALLQLAASSGGAYYRASDQETETAAILKHIAELERTGRAAASSQRYRNRYRLPLALALLLLWLELLLPERRAPQGPAPRARRSALGPASALAALLLLCLPPAGCRRAPADPVGGPLPDKSGKRHFLAAWPGPVSSPRGLLARAWSALELWRGNRSYSARNFDGALDRYSDASRKAPEDPKPVFNSGDALYKLDRFDEAREAFSSIADPAGARGGLAPKALYNQGNSHYRKGEFEEALQAYKRCLLLDPKDEDCRFNLAKAVLQLQKPPRTGKDRRKDRKDQGPGPSDKNQDRQKPSQPRPQSGLSQEDAERILQAVRERTREAAKPRPGWQKRPPDAGGEREADW